MWHKQVTVFGNCRNYGQIFSLCVFWVDNKAQSQRMRFIVKTHRGCAVFQHPVRWRQVGIFYKTAEDTVLTQLLTYTGILVFSVWLLECTYVQHVIGALQMHWMMMIMKMRTKANSAHVSYGVTDSIPTILARIYGYALPHAKKSLGYLLAVYDRIFC